MRPILRYTTLLFTILSTATVWAQDPALIQEHAPDGLLGCTPANFHVRKAYLICYDTDRRVPRWTMYHVTRDYTNTPSRKGRFSSFRADPDLDNEAKNSEYVGLLKSRGYARGHLTPYGVLGGDRDGDGIRAELNGPSDPDDEKTVFEGNYMSNIAPQHHAGFNNQPGLWYELERWIQDDMVKSRGEDVHVVAGAIFGPGEVEKVGPNQDIFVPPMFYKVVSFAPRAGQPRRVLVFLFPHQRAAHGQIQDFLISVDVLEAMTGLDFFPNGRVDEDVDTWETWEAAFAD